MSARELNDELNWALAVSAFSITVAFGIALLSIITA